MPGIVGFGAACAVAARELPGEGQRLAELRDRLWQGLTQQSDGVAVNGALAPRLPGNLNVPFEGSTAKRCCSASPSGRLVRRGLHQRRTVARADGARPSNAMRALASLRFGLGRATTAEDIDRAAAHMARCRRPTAPHLASGAGRRGSERVGRMAGYSAAVLERVRDPQRVGMLPGIGGRRDR